MQQVESKQPKPAKNPLSGRLVQALGKSAQKLGAVITPTLRRGKDALLHAAAKSGMPPEVLRRYALYALRVFFGFFMGYARFPQAIRPFGIASICAFSDEKSVLFVYIGAALSCFFDRQSALSGFILYFLLYVGRKAFTDSKFSEPLYARVLESMAVSAAIGVIRICAGRGEPVYEYVAFLALCATSAAYTVFFSTLFTEKFAKKSKLGTRSVCLYALMGAVTCAFKGLTVSGFDLQVIVACMLTLVFAAANGFMHAGIVGFVCGMMCMSPWISASMGLAGMAAAFLFSKGLITALAAFCGVFWISASYTAGLGTSMALVPSVLCAALLFVPACGVMPEFIRLNAPPSRKEKHAYSGDTCEKDLSDAFFSLSEVFSKLAEKKKYPSKNDVAAAVDKCFGDVCVGCALNEMCYARRKTDAEELKETLYAVLSARAAEPEDFGAQMSDKCIRLDSMCEALNAAYRSLSVTCAADNRTALLSSQYAGMARVLLDAEKRSAQKCRRDTAMEAKIGEALTNANVPFTGIICLGGREKKTRVSGINLDRFPFNAEEFKKYIRASCGISVTEPSFDISEKGGIVLSFERAKVIHAEYAYAEKAKEDDTVNGDTVVFPSAGDNTFYALLCDGMGSGIGAATASRLSSLFLEKMLAAGTKKSIILELLNTVLLSQSDENFSTVDLLETDLLTGRCSFVKAGAAPTYILREGKLYKIVSATPPVGILSSFTAESTRFDVRPGDLIFMLSDGIVQNGEDGAWLAELVKLDKTSDPSILAAKILERAAEINTRTDDASAAVIRIKAA